MIARLEADIGGRALGPGSSVLQRYDLRMWPTEHLVTPFPDHLAVFYQDTTDHRVRMHLPPALLRDAARALKVECIRRLEFDQRGTEAHAPRA